MRITWEVDDGYMGGARPQRLDLDTEDFEDCETVGECMELIYEELDKELAQIGYSFDEDEVKRSIQEMIAERDK